MRLYIAGLPNSGTTYVARLLMESGLNFGRDVWPHKNKRKGMEWRPVRNWYLEMCGRELGTCEPTRKLFTYDGRDAYLRQYPPPENPPDCLKVPGFNFHRLYEHYNPRHVLTVIRPYESWERSMMVNRHLRDKKLLREVYDFTLSEYPTENTIEFPRCVYDKDYAQKTLERFASVGDAWEEITNPAWVTR